MSLSEMISKVAKNTVDRVAEASKQREKPEETKADKEPVKQKPAPVADAETGAEPANPPSGQGDAPTANAEEGAKKPVPPRREAALANADGGSNAEEEGGEVDQPSQVEHRQGKIDSGEAGEGDSQEKLDEDVRQADLNIELAILDGEDGNASDGTEEGEDSGQRGWEREDWNVFKERGILGFEALDGGQRALVAEGLEEEQERLEDDAEAITAGAQTAGGDEADVNYGTLSPEERALLYQNTSSQEALLLRERQAITAEGLATVPLDAEWITEETGVHVTDTDFENRNAEIETELTDLTAMQTDIATSFTTQELEALKAVDAIEYTDENGDAASYNLNPEVAETITTRREAAIANGENVAIEVDGVTVRPGTDPNTFNVTVPANTSTTITPGVQGQSEGTAAAVVPNADPTALTSENANGWTTPFFDTETPAGEGMVLGNPTGQPISYAIQVDLADGAVSNAAVLNAEALGATETSTGENGTPAEAAAPPAPTEVPIDYTDGSHDEELLNAAAFYGVIEPDSRANFRFADPKEMAPESGGGELTYTVQPGEGYWQATEHVQTHPEGTNFNSNWSATWANNADRLQRTGENSDMLFANEDIAIAGWSRESLAEAFTSAGLLPTTTLVEAPVEAPASEETPTEESAPTSGPVPEGPGDPESVSALSDDPAEGGLATVTGNPETDLAAVEELVTLEDGTVVTGADAAALIYNSPGSDANIPLTAASEDHLNTFINGGEITRQGAIDDLVILDAVAQFNTALSRRYGQEAYMTGTPQNAFVDGVNTIADDLDGMRAANEEYRAYLNENPNAGATAPTPEPAPAPAAAEEEVAPAAVATDLPVAPASVAIADPTLSPIESFQAQTFTLPGEVQINGTDLTTAGEGEAPVVDPASATPFTGFAESALETPIIPTAPEGGRDTAIATLAIMQQVDAWSASLQESYATTEVPAEYVTQLEQDLARLNEAIVAYETQLGADPTSGFAE